MVEVPDPGLSALPDPPNGPPRPSRARFLRLFVVDVSPLRASPAFRWLFFGQIGAIVSRQILVVAVPYEVFIRTDSTLLVGLVGLVQVPPLVIFSFLGGVVADALDRRMVLVVVEALMALTCIGLALNVGSGQLWPIFVLIAVNAAISGVEAPAKSAVVPALVPPGSQAAAFSVHQSLNQTLQVVGPAAAGVLLATSGLQFTYLLAAAAGMATAVALIPLGERRPEGTPGRMTVGSAVEGWRHLRRVPLLQQMMLIDFTAMVFGTPRALFPAMGTVALGGDAATVGLLYAAPGAGAMVGALTGGWIPQVRRQGRAIVVAVVAYGAAIAAFGLTRSLVLALVILAISGAADIVSNVFRATLLQSVVPDHLRGRVNAFKGAMSGGGPRLGDATAGAAASAAGSSAAIVVGGIAVMASTAAIARFGRDIWTQDVDDTDPQHRGATDAVS